MKIVIKKHGFILDEIILHSILVPHLEHVVLDGADDDEDEKTSKAEFTHGPLSVPRYLGWS